MNTTRHTVLGTAILFALAGTAWAQSGGSATTGTAAPPATNVGVGTQAATGNATSGTRGAAPSSSTGATSTRTATSSVGTTGTTPNVGARPATATNATTASQPTADPMSPSVPSTPVTANGGDDFARFDSDRGGSLSRAELAGSTEVADRFTQIDTNADGTLSPDEWRRYRAANPVPTSATATTAGAGPGTTVDAGTRGRAGSGPDGRPDAGGTGRVGATVAPAGTVGLGVSDFARLDTNHDGLLTRNEMAATGSISSRLSEFDTDGNGTLSRAEWQGLTAALEDSR